MRRSIGFGSVTAIISGYQYAGDGWTKNSYEDQRKIFKTSSCTGDGIHELRIGWI